jgi:hypothetical protein
MPRLLDISGSANWANKADFGLSYHRDGKNAAELCVTKVRKGIRAGEEAFASHTITANRGSWRPHEAPHGS